MSQNKSNASRNKVAAENRRARYDYFVQNQLECGIALIGSEVKSLRSGKASISESYASIENGELWLINSYFPIYSKPAIDRQTIQNNMDLFTPNEQENYGLSKVYSYRRSKKRV